MSALRAGSRLLQELLRQQQHHHLHRRAGAAPIAAAASWSSSAATATATMPAAADSAAAEDPPQLSSPFTREQRMDALLQALVQPIASSAVNEGQLAPHLINLGGGGGAAGGAAGRSSTASARGARARLLLDPSDALTSLLRALLAARAVLREDGHVLIVGSSPQVQPVVRAAAASCLSPNVWFMSEGWRPGALTNHRAHRRLFRPDLHQPARRALRESGALPVNPHAAGGAARLGAGEEASVAPAGAAVGLAAAPPPPRLSWRDKWQLFSRAREPGTRALLDALVAREDSAQGALAAPGRPRGGALLPRLRLLVVLDPTTKNGVALKEAAARGVPTAALVAHNVDLSDVTYPILGRDASPRMAWLFLDRLVKVANVGL
jgi:hypothetical protein